MSNQVYIQLEDCTLERRVYGHLTDDEYKILCGFLFPYSSFYIKSSAPAKELTEDPIGFCTKIIAEGKEKELLQALNSPKQFGGMTYMKESDMMNEVFDSMIDVCPNVRDFVNSFDLVRSHLEASLIRAAEKVCDDLVIEVNEYLEDNMSRAESIFGERARLDLIAKTKYKAQRMNELPPEEVLLLKNKKFIEFVTI